LKLVWSEPKGEGRDADTVASEETFIKEAKFGEKSYSQIRRFAIVRKGRGSCVGVYVNPTIISYI
jgi:hypothetical protein